MNEHHHDTDTLDVTVNDESHSVPNTIGTAEELLNAVTIDSGRHELYRIDGAETVGPLRGLLIFDQGDAFVTVPKYITDG